MRNFEISVRRFDEMAHEYAERFMDVSSYAESLNFFCELITFKKSHILDLACGPGNVTRFLKQKLPDSKIVGIDLAPCMIEIAKNTLPDVNFRIMDIRQFSILPEEFDAIVCSFGLPFLSKTDASKLILDCGEKLASGGLLYLSSMEGNETRAGFETTSFSGDAEFYFNYHQQSDLEDALISSGFRIEQIKLQDFKEPDGRLTTDMIFIASKE